MKKTFGILLTCFNLLLTVGCNSDNAGDGEKERRMHTGSCEVGDYCIDDSVVGLPSEISLLRAGNEERCQNHFHGIYSKDICDRTHAIGYCHFPSHGSLQIRLLLRQTAQLVNSNAARDYCELELGSSSLGHHLGVIGAGTFSATLPDE